MTALRVVLGEDSFLAREAVTSVLARAPEIDLVGAAGDFEALRAAVDDIEPDVVLTDIRMPPTHTDEGVRLAHELRSTHPTIGVVVLSQFAEPAYAALLFERGSEGRAYLLKERVRDREELVRAVQSVASGGSVVDPIVVERLLARRAESRLEELTPRELEVLALIAQGRSNPAIADTLVVTKRAVERHVNSIFAKLDLGDAEDTSRRVEAALLYLAEH
jgi:DNA-binding NarL/FixJ family response regulator